LADRHRRLSVCSLPVLKQSGESLGSLISVAESATAGPGSLRAVCSCCFSPGGPRFLSLCPLGICEGYEVPLPAIHGEQIRHHFSSYGERRSIGIPLLFLSFIDQGQIMILSGCQLRGFHQHTLDMFGALFGKRGARHFVSGPLFIPAEPAITDGLPDRGET